MVVVPFIFLLVLSISRPVAMIEPLNLMTMVVIMLFSAVIMS